MNRLSKTKLIFYLSAIFFAGAVTGAMVSLKTTRQILAEEPRPARIEAHSLKERFHSKLDLTPEQAKVIDPILEKMSEDLKVVRAESGRHIAGIVKSSYDQIGKELTAEQRVKLEQMKKDRAENSHRRSKPPWESSRKSNAPPSRVQPEKGE